MNVHFTSLSAYTKPKIVEDKRKEYVAYGEDNLYFQYLIERYSGSTTNQAVIDSKAQMVFGKGLAATDAPQKIEDWVLFSSMLSDEDLKRVTLDRVMLGMGAILVTQKKGKVKLSHWAMDTLRAAKLDEDDTEVTKWFYHPNWAKYKRSETLESFKAYDPENTDEEQILIIKPYVTGSYYYPTINYSGALPYALLEEEISDYLINDVQGGFAATRVINFNNGIPSPEEQKQTVEKAKASLLGSTGMKTVFAFNEDETRKTTVDNIPLNDAPAHYQYLSEECENKILKGHKSPSVLLGFSADNAGLGNNAEELKNKMIAFDNYQIKPYQEEIIDHLNLVLNANNISLNLYFKTLEPLEFNDLAVVDEDTREEETGVQLSVDQSLPDLVDFVEKGEDVQDEWELVDEREVEYELEDELDEQVRQWESEAAPQETLSILQQITNLVSTGVARPKTKSAQDRYVEEKYYRVRYKYVESPASKVARVATTVKSGKPSISRPFCKAMESANKVYRKEDIQALSNKIVNPGFGPGGSDTYDIWLYKGGVWCGHRWQRVTYKTDSVFQTADESDEISNAQADREGYRVRNEPKVSQPPRFMPKNGHK